MKRDVIHHTLAPVFDGNSRILLLGTMPSPKSRQEGFYYMHPQNRFWPVLGAVLNLPVPPDREGKRALLLENHIALWDVLASCEIPGRLTAASGSQSQIIFLSFFPKQISEWFSPREKLLSVGLNGFQTGRASAFPPPALRTGASAGKSC